MEPAIHSQQSWYLLIILSALSMDSRQKKRIKIIHSLLHTVQNRNRMTFEVPAYCLVLTGKTLLVLHCMQNISKLVFAICTHCRIFSSLTRPLSQVCETSKVSYHFFQTAFTAKFYLFEVYLFSLEKNQVQTFFLQSASLQTIQCRIHLFSTVCRINSKFFRNLH